MILPGSSRDSEPNPQVNGDSSRSQTKAISIKLVHRGERQRCVNRSESACSLSFPDEIPGIPLKTTRFYPDPDFTPIDPCQGFSLSCQRILDFVPTIDPFGPVPVFAHVAPPLVPPQATSNSKAEQFKDNQGCVILNHLKLESSSHPLPSSGPLPNPSPGYLAFIPAHESHP